MSLSYRSITLFAALLTVFATAGCRLPGRTEPLTLYDLHTRQTVSGAAAMEPLQAARLILVGEHHTAPSHHMAQLAVIRQLNEAGAKERGDRYAAGDEKAIFSVNRPAIGLMGRNHRRDGQETRWGIAGNLDQQTISRH